jgi:hypothetical protein
VSSALLVEPAFASLPEWHDTDGPVVADVAAMAGFPPDPEQALGLDALFAVDAAGRSSAFEVAVVCCRQNMKTGLFKQAALGWLFVTEQRLIVWSAHEFATAQEAFRDMDELVTNCDVLRKRVKAIYRGNGDESIQLLSGARLIFKTRTKGGGRGLSGDKVILDEAFALRPMHMGALLPTLSARPDPQVVYGSSAGLVESDVLRGVRDRGRARADGRLAYLEWCAEDQSCTERSCVHALGTPGCALDDEAKWQQANPALGRRIDVEYVRAERRALPPLEFARERLGWWDRPSADVSAIPARLWADTEDASSVLAGLPTFAVATDPEREWSAIGAAGTGACSCTPPLAPCMVPTHIEVVAHDRDTDWLLARCRALDAEHGPARFVIDGGGPAGSLIDEFEAAFGKRLTVANTRDVARAYGLFMDALSSRSLRHGPQENLGAAVRAAKTRPCGDGGQAFGRKASGADITPLEVVALAHWAHETHGPVAVLNTIW